MKRFDIGFCLSDSEFMTALRLAVGAVCAAANIDVDGAEDMKVCVTESCLMLRDSGFESVQISLDADDGVSATVEGVGGNAVAGDIDFSLALVSALVSSCDIEKIHGAVSKITIRL